jgi:para-aminobenzoate synthetase component 1
LIKDIPRIVGVRTQTLRLQAPFEAAAARLAGSAGTVVLLSGGALDCSRYHILAAEPWLTIRGWSGKTVLALDKTEHALSDAPLDVLKALIRQCHLEIDPICGPVAAGLFGYLAYDLKDDLEDLPRTTVDDGGLPRMWLTAPSVIMVHDKETDVTRIHAPIRQDRDPGSADAKLNACREVIQSPPKDAGVFSGAGQTMRSNFSRAEYEAAVQRIRDYIAAGDVYQVNLSQRFEMGFDGDGYALFTTLFRMNPAPFFAYVNAGDHQIVSTSPERFILRRGRRVETRPIKGTRPRGKTPRRDRQLRAELANSPKDDAELSMIVDLLRNDIGKVCAGGSVVVTDHKRLEAYQNVYHLVSIVEGDLAEGRDSVDLIQATFPGGSITGCPKIRAMEIIDELEIHRRHVYTGSIGYISFHDTMDLSIAIRTAAIVDRRLVFSVGGGIVYDSDPSDEYEETLHKGRTLMSVFQGNVTDSVGSSEPQAWVWIDGRIVAMEHAVVPVSDLGLQYGFGFFETIRVERGAACRLPAHLNRFKRTWSDLFGGEAPDLTWRDIIAQVICKNDLQASVAAVKILATRGDLTGKRCNGTLAVTARPYVHRLAAMKAAGLKLATYPHPRATPLADHKTFNYLYYHQAGVWANSQGANEAVILNPDRSLSETNTANLLVIAGQTAIRPRSTHVLPGVMQVEICRRLSDLGFTIVDRDLYPEQLFEADAVLVTNALMGAVPVLMVDGREVNTEPTLNAALNRDLFSVKGG